MKHVNYNEELEKEKEKLSRLADEALKKGISLTQDESFMAQNRKVDELVFKIQQEKEKQRKQQGKNQQER